MRDYHLELNSFKNKRMNDFINVDLVTHFIKVTEVENKALTFLNDDDDFEEDLML